MALFVFSPLTEERGPILYSRAFRSDFLSQIGSAGSFGSVCYMPASERVKEEEGGEPKKPSASTPPHLGDLYRSLEPEINARLKPEAGPAVVVC